MRLRNQVRNDRRDDDEGRGIEDEADAGQPARGPVPRQETEVEAEEAEDECERGLDQCDDKAEDADHDGGGPETSAAPWRHPGPAFRLWSFLRGRHSPMSSRLSTYENHPRGED